MSVTTVVIPTVGRPSLQLLLAALARQERPVTFPVVVVDDRPGGADLDASTLDPTGRLDLWVLRSGGGGPARARNRGWRHARTPWVSFLDDDVVPGPGWSEALLDDLAHAEACGYAASQARLVVPPPEGRRPTDDERATLGLVDAWWITADMSVRRAALDRVGGFDERFPRAFREDTDLALRLGAARGRVVHGHRRTLHPVRQDDFWASLRRQRGNQDDQLMRRLHGRDWRRSGRAPRGALRHHAAVTASGALALGALAVGSRRLAAAAGLGWLAGTADFAVRRILPGPRTTPEVLRMTVTSVAIPPAACAHTAIGRIRHRNAEPWKGLPSAVLFDRDGTLVHDVPYNGDPDLVRPVAGAREVLDRLREAGVRIALVTNQSGIGRGILAAEDVGAVNARVAALLGPLDGCYVCPHAPGNGCECRKPAPGLVRRACAELGVEPRRVVVVGDIGADVRAAAAAGARAVLVPTPQTRIDEICAAPLVAADLREAAELILRGAW
ncbi:HAD-IIIA family hydrolase [Nocardioides sp. BYT-33-1]|uniref:HAD-IIIA family hydrolase n=1 Tax=Nocardioides sp. BYT-33-1 TaxID=3416952 RepID=UPI003F53AFFE